MSTRALVARICIVAGLGLFAVGLILGFLPKTANGVSCGSAFHGSDAAVEADFGTTFAGSTTTEPPGGSFASACADARSNARGPAVALLAVGAVTSIVGVAAASSQQQPAKTAS